MLDEEQKRILEELITKKNALDAERSQINDSNQPVNMGGGGNQNEQIKALLGCVGCAVLIFIIWVVISFIMMGYAFVNS